MRFDFWPFRNGLVGQEVEVEKRKTRIEMRVKEAVEAHEIVHEEAKRACQIVEDAAEAQEEVNVQVQEVVKRKIRGRSKTEIFRAVNAKA